MFQINNIYTKYYTIIQIQSYSLYNMPLPKIQKSKSNVSILTCEIYERIKQNARNSSQEDFLSQKIIKTQQKETQL